MRVADIGDRLICRSVEDRGGDDEDGGVDEQRRHQRDRGIQRRESDRFPLAGQRIGVAARLHDRECRCRLCGMTVAPRMPSAM